MPSAVQAFISLTSFAVRWHRLFYFVSVRFVCFCVGGVLHVCFLWFLFGVSRIMGALRPTTHYGLALDVRAGILTILKWFVVLQCSAMAADARRALPSESLSKGHFRVDGMALAPDTQPPGNGRLTAQIQQWDNNVETCTNGIRFPEKPLFMGWGLW